MIVRVAKGIGTARSCSLFAARIPGPNRRLLFPFRQISRRPSRASSHRLPTLVTSRGAHFH